MNHRLVAFTYHTPPQGISPNRLRGHQELLKEGERLGLFQLVGSAAGDPAIIARAPATSGAALIAFLACDPLLAGGLASYHFTAGAGPEATEPSWGRLRKGA
ncbi:hypothetical protein [Mesoterricola silvestris]|uniref:YCII-related domain-containing protein n=1 Tax=Mesoterricola silvestris TaxID=2927979 RepID=A0AA48K8V4_9BACT|nr:hypothetical protein [Mesoterricola silvestris]BDU71677.1 hypothetical protein METEAL_08510 [Mesoterricola silvestris]